MLGLSNLSDVWRVLKEADLNKLRREAERPFQVLLVAGDIGDAERLGGLLSGPEATSHPWLLTADPAGARQAARSSPPPHTGRRTVGFIVAVIIGGVIGWLASLIMKTNAQMGLIANIVVGVVGSLIGQWGAGVLGLAAGGTLASWLSRWSERWS
jgi:uncharacterized membrane protein YeaQ/YmgE (transglycosylase-associated protein family)